MKWSRQGWRSGELEGSKGGTPLPISAPDVGTSEHRGVAAGGEAGGQRSRTHGPRQPTAAAAHPTPQGGKAVVEIGGERVLVVKDGGEVGGGGGGGARVGGRGPAHPHLPTPSHPCLPPQVYAVSNKCTHLGLPLVGKTALLQGKVVDKCIVCPAHGTAFALADGGVKGEWCPSLPNLPVRGLVGWGCGAWVMPAWVWAPTSSV